MKIVSTLASNEKTKRGKHVTNQATATKADEAPTPSYTTLDITAGYRFDRYDVSLSGTNLTNQRQPVTPQTCGQTACYEVRVHLFPLPLLRLEFKLAQGLARR